MLFDTFYCSPIGLKADQCLILVLEFVRPVEVHATKFIRFAWTMNFAFGRSSPILFPETGTATLSYFASLWNSAGFLHLRTTHVVDA
jgi:hypothetical protein